MFLDKIVATKRQEVEALSANFQLEEAERRISELSVCRGFERALEMPARKRAMGLIAEVKKASPSKGLIREDFDPVQLAVLYQKAGADCISVLTDADYFQGSNHYLSSVREAVGIPLLRKDFTIDYRQIYEARLIGADAILLIAAILTKQQLSEYFDIAKSIGLDVLIEVHNKPELDAVLTMDKAALIGINNRDLKSFHTDLKTTEQLISFIPENVTIISESGISSRADMAYLQQAGADGALIGEHFMRQPNVEQAVHDLMG